jgi:dimethylaniline monooxygenase (N-oxide forming)
MAFSDFPIPHSWPTFLHNTAILKYFEDYANHFKLLDYIKFGKKVLSIRPLNGGVGIKEMWEIVYIEGAGAAPVVETYEYVFIATGHHWKPFEPHFEGLENFKGQVMHSHNYRDASKFKDKRCLVIGIGNSAVDMAVELSYHAKQVYLSSRKSAWVAPRYAITSMPADQVLSRFVYWFPLFIRDLLFAFAVWLSFGNIARFGLTPAHPPFSG